MLTNNYLAHITYLFCSSNVGNHASKDVNGNYLGAFMYLYNRRAVIGTGTTAPKKTDYKLESEIEESKYKAAISSIDTINFDNEGASQTISITVTNLDAEPLHVSEIGVEGWYTSVSQKLLWAREVFDTPITISPGGVQAFSLKLF